MSDWKLFLLSPDGNPNQELGFQCTVCGNSYKLFSSLKRHMKKHDSEPQHVCPVCYKTFYNKWEMTRHLNRTHLMAQTSILWLCLLKNYEFLRINSPQSSARKAIYCINFGWMQTFFNLHSMTTCGGLGVAIPAMLSSIYTCEIF